jgi:peroxiredoxin
MRRALLAAAFLAVSSTSALAGGANLDGQMAPEVTLQDGLNGASAATTLQSLRGKVVLIKFWLTRCPICRGTLPAYQGLHDRYGRSGVVCLSIVIDTPAGVGPYLREAGWTFPVGCDPQRTTASRYGMSRYPGDYVIGVDGRVRFSNGFPIQVIEEELRRQRVVELGEVPASLREVRDAVEEGDYGLALRLGEAAAKDGADDVRAAVERLSQIARQRQDNRFLRAEALARRGSFADARAELERTVTAFGGTSLEARAKERLDAFDASRRAGG